MKSVMKHQFSQVPKANISRSSFDRSHGYKTTFSASDLVPFYVDEGLPGDTFSAKMTGFGRLNTPVFPLLDNLYADVFYFACANRLLWTNWPKFLGEQTNPGDSVDYTIPKISGSNDTYTGSGSPWDYLGLPLNAVPDDCGPVSALPFRALALIYNEWFRDQNLQNSFTGFSMGDGPDGLGTIAPALFKRGKRHDYFTSCLPWPQKGEAVNLPLGTQAPILGLGTTTNTYNLSTTVRTGGAGDETWTTSAQQDGTGWNIQEDPNNAGYPNLYADLTNATAATINELRQAFAIQKLMERDARGGTRAIEIVKAHFLVDSPDLRATRPQYLGGSSSPVKITPIAQTSETSGSPQGNLAAMGTINIHDSGFTQSFTEHVTIIGLISVRADLTYQKGIDRMWSRHTKYDFFWPALQSIGEQSVLNKEIFVDIATPANNDLVFGYQERFAEYRYANSKITGLLRSDASGTLDSWHLSQDFSTLPVLDDAFITENVPMARVVAVDTEPDFLFDCYINLRCARPMPVYSTPGMIDHF